jgi:uncharacterized protein YjbI with pentapeptide repeats
MLTQYNQTYEAVDFTKTALAKATYECCLFHGCYFSGLQLSSYRFLQCRFEHCDLSNVVVGGTAFQEASFEDCKLIGIDFSHVSTFLLALEFVRCQLDLSDFSGLNLPNTAFGGSRLREVDFSNTALKASDLSGCDLERTTFEQTDLREADLREALHLDIDPGRNRIQKARLTMADLTGLLRKYQLRID